jgi:hypothetical protein
VDKQKRKKNNDISVVVTIGDRIKSKQAGVRTSVSSRQYALGGTGTGTQVLPTILFYYSYSILSSPLF